MNGQMQYQMLISVSEVDAFNEENCYKYFIWVNAYFHIKVDNLEKSDEIGFWKFLWVYIPLTFPICFSLTHRQSEWTIVH